VIGSFIALFRILAASQIVLVTVGFALSDNPKRVKFVLICLCLGILSYFLAPLVDRAPVLLFLLVSGFANAIPMFLWATCRFFFNDDLSLPSGWLLLAAISIALVMIADLRTAQLGALEGAQWWLLRVVPQLIKLAFTVLAIRTAWVGREVDLVTPRRRTRRWFALAVAIIVIAVVVTEIATGFQVPPWLEGVGMLAMFCAAVALNLTVFRLHPVFDLSHQQTPTIPPKGTQEDPLLIALEALMADERIYADHDVRIGGLAQRLGVTEHKLRATINGKLGYRNFNQYVNQHRINEAAVRLRSEPDLPVLSIALDVGFRSLSAFNKAFRDLEGCTPTQHRHGN
jgi:AraC-like DNA-binding protein